jgi:hypothetical protein
MTRKVMIQQIHRQYNHCNQHHTVAAAAPKEAALTGTLNNLWAIATEFKDLQNNKKVVFSFTFRDPDILTFGDGNARMLIVQIIFLTFRT